MRRIFFCLALLLAFFPAVVQAQSAPMVGSFAFALLGYTVQGQLSNAVINTDNTVSMSMALDDNLQTSMGAVPINASGEWDGAVNGTMMSGTIRGVSGSIQVCYLFFFCGYADFVGNGIWTGTLSSGQGSGTFSGNITFTSSSFSQVQLNQPIAVSGNWTSAFQSSS